MIEEKTRVFTWTEFDRACETLTNYVKKDLRAVNKIYGIPNGGLVPAVIMI